MRIFWAAVIAALAVSLVPTVATAAGESARRPTISMTGVAASELAALDDQIAKLMQKWSVPGGSLAVVKNGRLVYARGYGLADRDAGKPVQPDSLFRIASVSKPITAAAILVLVERGQLDLNAKLLDVVGATGLLWNEKPVDRRWRRITICDLLQHTAGFDRDKSFDPMFRSGAIAAATGTKPPAEPMAIIRYMLTTQRLDFDPGAKYAYSNFGYCMLGRVIERLTGKKYEDAVRELVLSPAGITRMKIGRTRLSERAPGEVRYYSRSDEPKVPCVFPDVHGPVSEPDGGFYLEALDAHGGWIASPIDLVRFAAALDGSRKPALLKPETVRLIELRPPPPMPQTGKYYGLGWLIRPASGVEWWHDGILPGTNSSLARCPGGLIWATVFNIWPKDFEQFERAVRSAIAEVKDWPDRDLFPRYR